MINSNKYSKFKEALNNKKKLEIINLNHVYKDIFNDLDIEDVKQISALLVKDELIHLFTLPYACIKGEEDHVYGDKSSVNEIITYFVKRGKGFLIGDKILYDMRLVDDFSGVQKVLTNNLEIDSLIIDNFVLYKANIDFTDMEASQNIHLLTLYDNYEFLVNKNHEDFIGMTRMKFNHYNQSILQEAARAMFIDHDKMNALEEDYDNYIKLLEKYE